MTAGCWMASEGMSVLDGVGVDRLDGAVKGVRASVKVKMEDGRQCDDK